MIASDVSRCMGLRRTPTGQERCTRRAHCLRYTALLSRDAQPSAVVPVCDWVCTDEYYSERIPVETAPAAACEAFCVGVAGRDVCGTCAGRYVADEGFPVPPRILVHQPWPFDPCPHYVATAAEATATSAATARRA